MKENMIFIFISAISLLSAYEYVSYTKERPLRFLKFRLLLELTICWIIEFNIFYKIKSIKNFENWSFYFSNRNEIIFTLACGIIVGACFTFISILIHFSICMHISKHKIDQSIPFKEIINKSKTKSLLTIKGVKIFPLISVVYAIVGLFVVVPIIYFITDNFILVERNSTISDWSKEDEKIKILNYEKISNDLKYPLIKIKGTDIDTDADVKILVLGDSFVWPYGASNLNYQWWNLLSNDLKRKGYNCTVYGVGRPGASTYDELQWLKTTSMISDLKPDIVIIGYVPNDPDFNGRNLPGFNMKSYGLLSSVVDMPFENLFKKTFPNVFNIFDSKLSVILGPTRIFNKKIGYQIATYDLINIDKEHLPQYDSYAIKPLGDFAASTGIPFILVTTPQLPDIKEFEPRYTPVLPLFEQAGIKVYNLLYDFYNTFPDYNENFLINPANDHPGTASTWFYAKYIADKLESDYSKIFDKKAFTGKKAYDIEINDWLPFSLNPHSISKNNKSAEFIISYPAENKSTSFLYLPVKTDYVKLNFEYPVDISSVTIEGKRLNSATLYTTGINNELGYDDQTMQSLGEKSGQVCTWTDDSSRRVTSLCIHAEILNGSGDNLTVKINCEEGGVQP